MNRFAKIMQFLGWAGVAVLTAVWAQGFLVHDDAPQLARHSAIAIVAAGACILPRFWTVAYLALAARGRESRRRAAAGAARAGAAGESAPATRLRRRAIVTAAVALVALSGSFALAGAILQRRTSPAAHAAAGFVAIALQVVALIVERRALLADAGEMAALPAGGGPARDAA